MDFMLTPEEQRILGALIEKQLATPDYYPLSLSSLIQACNQKSSRNPVVQYSETQVLSCLKNLYDRVLINEVTALDRRVKRYDQRLSRQLNCSPQQTAILCVLLLRGPQTPGEIKGRTGRLYSFESLHEVVRTLEEMQNREEFALVQMYPRQPGRKESRYGHCLGDSPLPQETRQEIQHPQKQTMQQLTEEVQLLGKQLEQLKIGFDTFKRKFE